MRRHDDCQHRTQRFMSKYPLTSIHPDAQIGQNVVIEPFTTISKDVVIGDRHVGGSERYRNGRCTVLERTARYFPGAVISGIPQDLKFKGEVTTAEIGDNTTIRECVTLNRGTVDKYKTAIGSNLPHHGLRAHRSRFNPSVTIASSATRHSLLVML